MPPDPPDTPEDGLRLDKWLWHARFFRTRSAAVGAIEAGQLRVNGIRVSRPGRIVRCGDTLTLVAGGRVRLVRVLALGLRRGPASEAATLWRDLDAPSQPQQAGPPALE